MKRNLTPKSIFFVGVLGVLLLGLIGGVFGSEISKVLYDGLGVGGGRFHGGVDQPPARRSLLSLSDEHDTLLVAALDGTINLVDPKSATVLWSFASGPSIYSSYQAPVNHDNDLENASVPSGTYFVDCGDDWKLFAHTELGKVNLDMTPEEFLRITPHIAEDGGVVLGSKKTTVFLVDARTGRLIHTYKLSDSPSTSVANEHSSPPLNKYFDEWDNSSSVNLKPDELPLYITRTDYLLKSFAANSGKVMWNVTVSDIGAAFLCQDIENSFSGPPPNMGNELPSEPGVSFNMPLSCQSKAVVFRVRDPRMLESLSIAGRLIEDHQSDAMLPFPSTNDMLPSPIAIENFFDFDHKNEDKPALPMPTETKKSGNPSQKDVKMLYDLLSGGTTALSLIPFLIIFIGFITRRTAVARKSIEQPGSLNAKAASSKKKKPRKSGKGKVSSDEERSAQIDRETKPLLNFNQMINFDGDGRNIGKLFVSSKEIAKGSNGTIVLEGIYEGRPVAVKRLVRAHHDVAFKEIQNLIASDRHLNIVRWYGVEYDQDFVYLSLERCTCSLNDLILMYSHTTEKPPFSDGQPTKAMTEYKVRLDSLKGIMHDVELWRSNGYPSPLLLKLMRDVVSGLVHLHELGIIHRDLKPQNVLIIKERLLCAKLSDMGISKRLVGDMSSLGHHATGYGSSGWQAPEQLLHGRQTRAVDLFSLGCVLFYCITGGRHPFGEHLERDSNVAKNQVDLFLVENIPEAVDLFSHLLDPCADHRPKAVEVLHHPLFWNSETRLSFLRDTSDRVELEDRETNSSILQALESTGSVALGGKWDEKMEPSFITNIGRYRRYRYDSIRDLLRVIRNKLNHYRELPKEIQELLGAVPEGFDNYFASRFPKFLIEVYKVMYRYCKEEEWFHKYQNSDL